MSWEQHEDISNEPLILEKEEWTKEEWETINKLFGLDKTEVIKVEISKMESFECDY